MTKNIQLNIRDIVRNETTHLQRVELIKQIVLEDMTDSERRSIIRELTEAGRRINSEKIKTAEIDKVSIGGKGNVVFFIVDNISVLVEFELKEKFNVTKQYEVRGSQEQEGYAEIEGIEIIDCWLENEDDEELECDNINEIIDAVKLRSSDIIELFYQK